MDTAPRRFEIVIVGGGAGGVELAARLGRRLGAAGRDKVLLVDCSPRHIWKPTLHEIAAGTMDASQEGLSYLSVARRNHFSFALGELRDVDAEAREIVLGALDDDKGEAILPERRLSYHWLVLAIGCGSNFFGTPGAAAHAHVLESADDAERFRRDLLIAFMRSAYSHAQRLELVIVGGGATGVELSAELREAHAEALGSIGPEFGFDFGITVVEAADRILNGLPQPMSEHAASTLKALNIGVRTGTKVLEVHADALTTSEGTLPADLTVWAAGIQAPEHNASFGLEVNRKNQFVVNDRLEASAADVYAMGDCAACPWRDGQDVPARAQAAHQQADYLDETFARLLSGQRHEKPFRYRDFGSLVSLGENRGVGNVMSGLSDRNHFVGGVLAKLMYMSLHLNHHRVVIGSVATAVLALARLLQRRISGRVKLH